MDLYLDACAWLQRNFCCKYSDYRTECEGCPFSKVCYQDLPKDMREDERTAVFETSIINEVEKMKRSVTP